MEGNTCYLQKLLKGLYNEWKAGGCVLPLLSHLSAVHTEFGQSQVD